MEQTLLSAAFDFVVVFLVPLDFCFQGAARATAIRLASTVIAR